MPVSCSELTQVRLPLWRPYRRLLDGKVADLTNAPDSPYAGAILAARELSTQGYARPVLLANPFEMR